MTAAPTGPQPALSQPAAETDASAEPRPSEAPPPGPVVTAGGPGDFHVLRWHTSAHALRLGAWLLEVSWWGVMTGPGVYLTDIPGDWVAEAFRAYRLLKDGRSGELAELVSPPPGAVVPAQRDRWSAR